jgi:hypothetical protein
MLRSGPLNLDPAAQICWLRVLITDIDFRSGGWGEKGRVRRWCAAAGDESRGGAVLGSPEFGVSCAPGLKLTRARVWVLSTARRSRLGTKLGSGKPGAVLAAPAAGWRGEASPARAFKPCLCQTKGAKRGRRSVWCSPRLESSYEGVQSRRRR